MASRCGSDDFLTRSRTGNVENTLSEEAVVFVRSLCASTYQNMIHCCQSSPRRPAEMPFAVSRCEIANYSANCTDASRNSRYGRTERACQGNRRRRGQGLFHNEPVGSNAVWLRPGWDYFSNFNGDARACEPVCRRRPARSSRETAGLSGWPSSEPCTARADGRVLLSGPSACGTCSADAPLSPYCPKQYRQRSCASEDWGVREVPLRHRRVGRVGLPKRGPFFPASQWLELYGRFPRVRCSNAGVRCAFRYPLGKTFFPRAKREDGRR